MNSNPKPGYKLTEIGEIPEEWEVVRLGDVLKDEDPGVWGKEDKENEIAVLRSTNFKNDGYISYDSVAYRKIPKKVLKKKTLKSGNILLERSGGGPDQPVGRVAFFDETDNIYTFGNFIQRLIPDGEKTNPFFLFKVLHYIHQAGYTRRLQQQTTGIRNLDYKSYLRTKLPLPPLPEQQKIAEILSTVDEAIQKTDEIIAKTQGLKKGLMQQLLTKGIGHTRFKKTEIGEIPEEWEVVRLGDVLTHCEYGLSVKLSSSGKYPIFRMNNIENGYVVENDMKYVDLDDGTFNHFKLEKGDILFNRTNSYDLVGKVGIFLFEGDYTFASYLIRLRANRLRANPFFINSYLNADRTQFRLLYFGKNLLN